MGRVRGGLENLVATGLMGLASIPYGLAVDQTIKAMHYNNLSVAANASAQTLGYLGHTAGAESYQKAADVDGTKTVQHMEKVAIAGGFAVTMTSIGFLMRRGGNGSRSWTPVAPQQTGQATQLP